MNQDRDWQSWSLPPLLGEPESPEIHEIHRAIVQREQAEPKEGLEPAPWWVWAISVVTIFSMGFYLGRYSGSFRPVAHELNQQVSAAGAAPLPAAPPQGSEIYSAICLPCHQAGGTGVEDKYPPLAGSEWPVKDAGIPVRILLNGLEGPIQVKGRTFVNQMPALGGQLQDDEIAAVLTFVRASWSNHAGPVPVGVVEAVRRQTAGQGPWTAEKLNALGDRQ